MSPRDSIPLWLEFSQIAGHDLPRVGGKGANLGALTGAGIPVPPGFCLTTAAYDQFLAALPNAESQFAALENLDGQDVTAARLAAEAMRGALSTLPMPPAVSAALAAAHDKLGADYPLAVRSSATAEDLPGASFAGQQDTYLNIRGREALIDAVRRCWISLFTDRAVLYRARSRFGQRSVRLAVVVQRLVDPEVSGILFTADPVSGHRGTLSIDAGFGLGEALVSGLISADLYRVDRRRQAIILAQPGDKAFAIRSLPGGGTEKQTLPPEQRQARALDDAQVLALASLGERIEAFYGGVPQDVEWCIAGGQIHIVQARPITSLYPPPEPRPQDGRLHIYFSFGHVQMMLEPMPRLSREVWMYFFPAGKGDPTRHTPATKSPYMTAAGSRLYGDITALFAVPRLRRLLLSALSVVYSDVARGLALLSERLADEPQERLSAIGPAVLRVIGPVLFRVPLVVICGNPEAGAADSDRRIEALQNEVRARILAPPTPQGRLRAAMSELNGVFSEVRAPLSRMAAGLLSHRLLLRLATGDWAEGVRDALDDLLRGLPGNVTTGMDLEVGDLADRARPHADLVSVLRADTVENAWPALRARIAAASGGPEFLVALDAFLARYGARAAGEIDVSRTRWGEDPTALLRAIAGGLSAPDEGSHRRRHAAQVKVGEAAQQTLIDAAGRGFFGAPRRWLVRRLCRVVRAGQGLREHPKFLLVRVLGALRQVVLSAGETLVGRGQLAQRQDIFHFGFDEIISALEQPTLDLRTEAAARVAEFARDRGRRPPFVLSSEGETPTLTPTRDDLPAGALAGTAASGGVVTGIARVVRDPEREMLQAGEILVAAFTDPGWTPLFVHAAGVVTEVGGLMTHGAVVAREYGIPAVVSVAGALDKIHSGQRICVDGTRGFVQILEDA
jgi:pyruvate,water dikinase